MIWWPIAIALAHRVVTDRKAAIKILKDLKSFPSAGYPEPLSFADGKQVFKYRRLVSKVIHASTNTQLIVDKFVNQTIWPNLGKHLDAVEIFRKLSLDIVNQSLLGIKSPPYQDHRNLLDSLEMEQWFPSPPMQRQTEIFQERYHISLRRMMPIQLKSEVLMGRLKENSAADLLTFVGLHGTETMAATLAALAFYLARYQVKKGVTFL